MKKELAHFEIDDCTGGNQDWFLDPMMKLGGCGAVTACDTCIWLARSQGETWLYPFDSAKLTRTDFLHFGRMMKPYLRPRAGGISRLELYMRGFSAYIRGREEVLRQEQGAEPLRRLRMEGFEGSRPAGEAWEAAVRRIEAGFPVPMLVLRHQDPAMEDYVWHWFLLTGYEEEAEPAGEGNPAGEVRRKVKTVTYGETAWVDFDRLWDTGHELRGGLVLYRWEELSSDGRRRV